MPPISAVVGAIIGRLHLRGNVSKTEIERLRATRFATIADTLLEEGHITHLEYHKLDNFLKIAKKADEVYKNKYQDQKHTNKGMDFDWFVRFFEDSGNISNEEMQELWAKILAGEIAKPGSFSRRTLDVLRNLSQADAQLFRSLSKYFFFAGGGIVLYRNSALHNEYGIKYSQIKHLTDCGLFSAHLPFAIFDHERQAAFHTEDIVCVANIEAKSDGVIEYPVHPLTSAGVELLRVDKLEADVDFLFSIVNALPTDTGEKQVSFSLRKIEKISGDTVYWGEQPLRKEEIIS